jgi:hypothetical protein
MDIPIPDDIRHYEPELRFFLDCMVRKLHISRHRGFVRDRDLGELRDMLSTELAELDAALLNESQFSILLESVDVANQAFLLGLAAMQLDKRTFEARRAPSSNISGMCAEEYEYGNR